MRLLNLDEKKSMVLEILDDIDQICKAHGILYFLAYGTLIGAIRHKGFIPWDDDIDVWVPVEYYEQLLGLLEQESRFTLLNSLTNPDWPRPFSKLSNENTKVVDRKSNALNLHRGISVDIFPLGRFDDKEAVYKKARNMISRINSAYLSRTHQKTTGVRPFLSKMVGAGLLLISEDELYWQKKFLEIQKEENGSFRGFLGSKYRERDIVDAAFYEGSVEVDFEGKRYPAPAQYDLLLKSIYGDYMALPPADQQVSNHDVEVYLLDEQLP